MKRRYSGFTIVELAVVIMVIGILAAVGTASYLSYLDRTDAEGTKADLQQVAMKLESYKAANGDYPANEATLGGFPKSAADRTYTYKKTPGQYCVGTVTKRGSKPFRVTSSDAGVVSGVC
jgi:type II secretion system protein G